MQALPLAAETLWQTLPACHAPANRCTPSMTQFDRTLARITHTDLAENSAALVKTRIPETAVAGG